MMKVAGIILFFLAALQWGIVISLHLLNTYVFDRGTHFPTELATLAIGNMVAGIGMMITPDRKT